MTEICQICKKDTNEVLGINGNHELVHKTCHYQKIYKETVFILIFEGLLLYFIISP